jgi:hypothetical protein
MNRQIRFTDRLKPAARWPSQSFLRESAERPTDEKPHINNSFFSEDSLPLISPHREIIKRYKNYKNYAQYMTAGHSAKGHLAAGFNLSECSYIIRGKTNAL